MEPKKHECLTEAANDIKVQGKLSYMHMRIEGLLLPGRKLELRSFTSSGCNRE